MPSAERLCAAPRVPATRRRVLGGLLQAAVAPVLLAGAFGPARAAAGTPAAPAAAGRLPDALQRPALRLGLPGRQSLLGLAAAGPRQVAVGERGTVLLSDDGGRQWRQAAAVPVSVTLTGVQFADARSGWAIGHQGVVLATTDGGEHWQRRLDGLAAARLALAELQARPDADPKALAMAERTVADGADKPLLALDFSGPAEGLVAGAYGLLLATRDGGRAWQSIAARLDNPKGGHLYALRRDGTRILIAGEQGLAFLSEDGGQSFRRLVTPYQGSWFTAAFEADGALLLAGLRGNVQRSRDGGRSWQALDNPVPVSLTGSLRLPDGRLLLANQAGQLLGVEATAVAPRLPTAAQQPAALALAPDGALLIAGWNGLTRVAPESLAR
ncbi:WD40/YVTN/BNR-like repeat-containing protein [Pseudaquabacterium rugosum]|uniref:YCF48-related protein n=1 Tax=Pseudaquabacterium rugosum TaxID=2984194 RepID=A0ABU9BGG2_9BURK